MLFQKPYGVSPTIDIFVGEIPFSYRSVLSIKVVLSEGKHDMLVLTATGLPPTSLTEFWGKPVKVMMEEGGSDRYEFVGYIDEVRPESHSSSGLVNQSLVQTTELVCLGVSYEMRGEKTKVWSGHTLPAIVRKMAGWYGMSSSCIDTPFNYGTLVQAGVSDWKFLSDLVAEAGLAVNCHGTHLHVYDPRQALTRRNSFHTVYTMAAARGDVTEFPGQILKMNANLKFRMREQTSVLTPSGKVFDVKEDGLVQTKVSSTYASSKGEADRALRHQKLTEYDDIAQMRVTGIAGCVPGGVINIVGYEEGLDGLWYVSEVTHRVDSKTYYTDLTVCRNRDDELVPSNTTVHSVDDRPTLRQSKWVASRRRFDVYT